MHAPSWPVRPIIETALGGKAGFDDGDWIEAPYITSDGIRLIQTGNVGIGEFLDKSEHRRFVSERTFRTLGCKWVHPGDILICRLADPIGRACQVPREVGDSITAVDCTIYRPDPATTDARFALHWFNSAWHLKAAQDVAGGSTRQRISRGHLGRLGLPSPPLAEQRQIAAILDTIDDAIRKTEQIIAKLKRVKQGLLHDLLTRGIDDNGELRDPERHPEQFQDSSLGRIPRGWEVAALGTLAQVTYGVNDAIDQSLTDGVATITLPCVSAEGDLSLSDIVWTAPHKVGDELLLQPGDVLFNWRNGSINHLGKTAFFSGEQGVPMTHVGFLLRVRADRERARPGFLWHELRHLKETGVFLRAKMQVNNTFNSEELRALQVVCPPLREQEAIATALNLLEDRAQRDRQETAKLRLLKQGLMEDLLTGRVRVTKLLENAAE